MLRLWLLLSMWLGVFNAPEGLVWRHVKVHVLPGRDWMLWLPRGQVPRKKLSTTLPLHRKLAVPGPFVELKQGLFDAFLPDRV